MYLLSLIIICVLIVRRTFCKVEVNSGIYLERLPSVNLYEASSPLLFKIRLGDIKKVHCNSQCNSALCHFMRNSSFVPFDLQSPLVKDSEPLLNDDGEEETYELITKSHVKRLFTTEKEIQLLEEGIKLRNLSWEEIELSLDWSTRVFLHDPCGSAAASWGSLNWAHRKVYGLMQMCQIKKLRPDIIPFQKLQTTLVKYKNLWETNGYTTTFKEFSKYYDVSLLECALTSTSAIIGVHVPLIRKTTQGLEIRRLITPSFAWNKHTCSLGLAITDLAFPKEKNNATIFIPRCDPIREDTCYLSEPSGEYMSSILCAKLVMNGATVKALTETCPITCRETGEDIQYVTPLTGNRFLINHYSRNLSVRCQGQSSSIITTESIGAMMVHLPCGCSVYPINSGFLQPRQQCVPDANEHLSHHLIIPAIWSKISSMSIPSYDEKKPSFFALEDCLNRNWMAKHTGIPVKSTPSYHLLTLLVDATLIALIAIIYVRFRRSLGNLKRNMYQYIEDRISRRMKEPPPAANTHFGSVRVASPKHHSRLRFLIPPASEIPDYIVPTCSSVGHYMTPTLSCHDEQV